METWQKKTALLLKKTNKKNTVITNTSHKAQGWRVPVPWRPGVHGPQYELLGRHGVQHLVDVASEAAVHVPPAERRCRRPPVRARSGYVHTRRAMSRARSCVCMVRSRLHHQAGFFGFGAFLDRCLISLSLFICSFIQDDWFFFPAPPRQGCFFSLIWKQSPHTMISARMNQHDEKFRWFILQHVTQKHMRGRERIETGARERKRLSGSSHRSQQQESGGWSGGEGRGGTEGWRPTLFWLVRT